MAIPLSCRAENAAQPQHPVPLPTLGLMPGDAAPLQQMTGTRTINIIDGLTLNLNRGNIVELSGIWVPQGQGFEPSDQEVAAKKFMDSLFNTGKDSDKDIYLYEKDTGGVGRVNRLGHELAQVVRKNGNVWVQGAKM